MEIKRQYIYLMEHIQVPEEVKVEKIGETFLVKVICKKGDENKLVSILEVFDEMGVNVVQASVSCNYYFSMEAIVAPQNPAEAMDVRQVIQLIISSPVEYQRVARHLGLIMEEHQASLNSIPKMDKTDKQLDNIVFQAPFLKILIVKSGMGLEIEMMRLEIEIRMLESKRQGDRSVNNDSYRVASLGSVDSDLANRRSVKVFGSKDGPCGGVSVSNN
ncbi:hypothetical protein LWI28_001333 [Acer negundo]|uniref:Plant bHLH transcription factor ACT-like domain-containing protein n=1 Tax=Acer negundo TaxID=4023 RepID=A0AAD5P2F7_ACENE|nr:hypothetical protein LWI28_001333 [Acer negundo]